MARVSQRTYHRQRCLKHAAKHGVAAAADRYGFSRKTVYKWQKRYDGTPASLEDRSRRPHHIPAGQTEAELQQVKRYAKKYPGDLLLGWQKAREHGYTRSYGCYKRTVYRMSEPPKKKKKKRQNKPCQRAEYPGQKIQIDVKLVSDGREQLAEYQRKSNDYIMTCLGMRSPNQVLDDYRGIMW